MPGYTRNSIVIDKEIDALFLLINNIENWPVLHGYQAVELLDKEKLIDGRTKLRFRITGGEEGEHDHDHEHDHGAEHDHEETETWVSQRIIDRSAYFAYAVRLNPVFPFTHWILFTELTKEKAGTRMTWIQDFAIDPKTGHSDEEIQGYINKGSVEELKSFKRKIEQNVVTNALPLDYL
ncbi:MAG: hypothetical protein GF344_13275 [Chitinivibrionales bacterium]|nr:hypothetical protein [Chitinivibrionales bacterium]